MESFPPRPLIFRFGIPWRHQGSIPKYAIVYYIWVVVLDIVIFHPYLGKWSNLTHIFQIRWNHQLVYHMRIHVLMNHDEPTRCNVPWQYEHDLHASSCSEAIIHNIYNWILNFGRSWDGFIWNRPDGHFDFIDLLKEPENYSTARP